MQVSTISTSGVDVVQTHKAQRKPTCFLKLEVHGSYAKCHKDLVAARPDAPEPVQSRDSVTDHSSCDLGLRVRILSVKQCYCHASAFISIYVR
jgi:hypothetical protein